MHHHRLTSEFDRRFLLVFDDRDELVADLARFVSEQGIEAAEFTGIGSLADVEFDGVAVPLGAQSGGGGLDVRTLDGRVAFVDGDAKVAAHAVVRTSSGESVAGRLTRGVVREALKLVLTESEAAERRAAGSTNSRIGNRPPGYRAPLGVHSTDLEVQI